MASSSTASPVDHLTGLACAVSGVSGPFCCGGTVDVAAPVRVRLTGSPSSPVFEAVPSKESTWAQEKEAAALIGACERAPFGHGAQTKYNPAVRDALQLKADAFQLENFDPESAGE